MNKIKFRNFIKKILVSLLMIFAVNGSTSAFARAGGGGHSSSSHSSSSSSSSSGGGNLFELIGIFIVLLCIFSAVKFVFKLILDKRKAKSISVIKELSQNDNNWNYNNMEKDIEEAFYKVQAAWMERNQELAREYMSDKLYNKHKLETKEMRIKKEINILEDMTLLSDAPIGLQDFKGIDKDYIWVHIRAKSKDYTVDEKTSKVVEGEAHKIVHFEEYWKFIRNEYRWVLDEIRQTDDIRTLKFFKIKVDN
ncbi:Tim44 domain-containing protein [Clostridium weizhouense]|uniref:39S ribosomal protein L45 n=1 Tax=Clostridium weizhouense TaxID=2859781 RepID=A0ABS7ANK8_9CLOT|nr:Tim44-like domain-containing protein [Clostridium weizhouense]MBW6410134.1 39S ribosomal protein L45 [Clostridium weizhouense]